MGVMEYSRGNCDNIMCRRYSSRHGYICGECYAELIEKGPETNTDEFMSSDVGRGYTDTEAADAGFNIEFPRVDE